MCIFLAQIMIKNFAKSRGVILEIEWTRYIEILRLKMEMSIFNKLLYYYFEIKNITVGIGEIEK